MAMDDPQILINRFPQPNYIDAVRWLPPITPVVRHAAVAAFDPASSTSSLQIHSLTSKTLTLQHSSPFPSRITSLKTSSLLAASTAAGSLHFLSLDSDSAEFGVEEVAAIAPGILKGGGGGAAAMDLMEGGGAAECVTAGEDGRVNVARLGEGVAEWRRVYDGSGLVSYAAAKWASSAEFATGGLGFGVQWWDLRRPGPAVLQFKAGWGQQRTLGIVHSIDIHPSRKHTCLAGGSLGTVFAWDIRWPKQSIILSGDGEAEIGAQSPSESEVWEVQHERHSKITNAGNISSGNILPAMMCSEDGILAVVEQGEEPLELLEEPCAINSFDIDRHNPSEVICSLEWELIAILTRH